jgi:hypothetical protein
MSNSVYRRPQWRPLLLCLLALVFTAVSGCGKRGDPMPPSLVVPAPIKSLHVVAKPGKSFLAWSLPRKNSDGSRPVDLVAFRIYHKRVPVGEDSCKFCDEGFRKEFDIVVRKPERGYILGETFYFPYDWAAPGTVDVFFVVSLNSRDWESPASNKIAVPGLPALSPPRKVKCLVSASVAELHWQPSLAAVPAGAGLFYNVYRRKSSNLASPLKLITPEPIDETSYIDVGLTDWRAYEYCVTQLLVAGDVSRESDYSQPVKVIPGDYTPPAPVQNFVALCYLGGIQLVWDPAQDADLAGYRVYRFDTVQGIEKVFTVNPARHEYFDREIIPGRKYIYKVTSFDTSERQNESPPSQPVTIFCNGQN